MSRLWTPVLLASLLLTAFLFSDNTAPGPCFRAGGAHAGHDFFTGTVFLGQSAAAGVQQPLRAETGVQLLRTLFSPTHLILAIILEGAIFSCIFMGRETNNTGAR